MSECSLLLVAVINNNGLETPPPSISLSYYSLFNSKVFMANTITVIYAIIIANSVLFKVDFLYIKSKTNSKIIINIIIRL